ncbi:hypothetical protein C8R44DRAFT_728334 [Mycena epipterygia]|nr:hypothetical protein C8R44DRAFT_728334 [Mycena epipterygia]
MSALTRNPSTDTISNEIILKYYVQRAAGGAGLIVSEGTLITRQGSISILLSMEEAWQRSLTGLRCNIPKYLPTSLPEFSVDGEKCYVIEIHGLKSKIWQYDRRHIESHLKSLQAGDDWRDHTFRQSKCFEVLSLYWPTVYDEPTT